MRRATPNSLHDRAQALVSARDEAEAEVTRLARETEYLKLQIRQAREQVRYYEELLILLRKDWGRRSALPDVVRRL